MLQYKQLICDHWYVLLRVNTLAAPTVVVSVQTLECQAQLLLVIFQILGELVEIETPVFVLVTRRHDFLQRGDFKNLTVNLPYPLFGTSWGYSHTNNQRHSHTLKEFHAETAGQALKLKLPSITDLHGHYNVVPVQHPGGICPLP